MSLWTDADWHRLIASFEGRLSPDEARHLERWIAEHPDRAAAVAQVRTGWELSGYPASRTWPVESMHKAVVSVRAGRLTPQTIQEPSRPALRQLGTRRVHGNENPYALGIQTVRLGARSLRGGAWGVIVVLSLVGVLFLRRAASSSRMHSYATSVGQRAEVRLTDGTRVTLAPRTVLRVAGDFGAGSRTVSLDGEARFAVQSAAGIPFVVRTGAVSARVLGTEFTVRRYAGDPTVRVTVVTGKVLVAAHTPRRPTLMLTAGVMGEVTDSTASVMARDGGSYTDWRHGTIVFREASATEVLAALSRWYGYEFRVTDSVLSRQRLTVVLSTRSSRAALTTLKTLLDVDLTFVGNVVTLTPHGVGRAPTRRDAQRDLLPNRSEAGR